jgi:hypothetical protein
VLRIGLLEQVDDVTDPLGAQTGDPPGNANTQRFSHWFNSHRLASVAVGVAAVLILAAVGIAIFNRVAPVQDVLPSTPPGWTRLLTATGSQSSRQSVNLHGVQLRICWSVRGGDLKELQYQIGSPLSGPTTLYDVTGNSTATGCVFDPGNDDDIETFSVVENGIGSYAVSLDEELTPLQEQAIKQQAEQEAQAQARAQAQAQAQAEAQAQANALKEAQSKVDDAANAVASDVQNLQSDTSNLQSDLGGVNQALRTEQQDLAKVRMDSANTVSQAQSSGPNSTLCGTADGDQGEADGVQGDADSVQGSLDGVSPFVQSSQHDLATLSMDQATYNALANSVTGYTTPNIPSSSSIQAAITAAQALLSSASSLSSSATTNASQMVSEANAAASSATSAAC